MTLLWLRLRLGRHLSLSPALLLSLSPLVVRILAELTVPLLSLEWGAREDLGVLVALAAWGVWVIVVLPPAIPLPQVSLLTPPTERFRPTTVRVQFRRQFLLSSSTIMGLLHLLGDIPTSLHLWHHCSDSFSAAVFAPWGYLHFISFGPLSVRLACSLHRCGSSRRGLCDSSRRRLFSPAGSIQFFFLLHFSCPSQQALSQDRAFQAV